MHPSNMGFGPRLRAVCHGCPHDTGMRAGASIYSLVTIGSHLVIMNAATLGSSRLVYHNSKVARRVGPSLSAPADNDISRSLELFLHSPVLNIIFFTLLANLLAPAAVVVGL